MILCFRKMSPNALNAPEVILPGHSLFIIFFGEYTGN